MDKKRKERILYNAKSKDLKKIVEVNKLGTHPLAWPCENSKPHATKNTVYHLQHTRVPTT